MRERDKRGLQIGRVDNQAAHEEQSRSWRKQVAVGGERGGSRGAEGGDARLVGEWPRECGLERQRWFNKAGWLSGVAPRIGAQGPIGGRRRWGARWVWGSADWFSDQVSWVVGCC